MNNHFFLKKIAGINLFQAISAIAISAQNQHGFSSPWVRKSLNHVGNQAI